MGGGWDWERGEEEQVQAGDETRSGGHRQNLCPALGRGAQYGTAPITTCKIAGKWSSPIVGAVAFFGERGQTSSSLEETLATATPPAGSHSRCFGSAARTGAWVESTVVQTRVRILYVYRPAYLYWF